MAPRAKKGPESGKARGVAEEEPDEPLQAVVLADSYERRFDPFTLDRPRCLLPLANIPLIEYTLDFLANAGVDEVYICCGAHTDQVEDYVNKSKWRSTVSPFDHVEIVRSTAQCVGDVMRDLDEKAFLTGDFIVVYGDVVSNFTLDSALAMHRQRRKKDKDATMTMVLREAGTQHRTKAEDLSPVFVIDPSNGRCLYYDQLSLAGDAHSKRLRLDPANLTDHDEIEIRQDLIDCGIDIYTPQSLSKWSDNFDFQAPRRDYLHRLLTDEVCPDKFHTHIIKDQYAARVRNLRSYDAVSRDILGRWAYPICPDNNMLEGQTFQTYGQSCYREDAVRLANTSILENKSMVGKGSSIGEGTTVTNSVIGRNTKIGNNTRIHGSYILDNVTINDGCVIEHSMVASDAVIGNHCEIKDGVLVGFGVQIQDHARIAAKSRLTRSHEHQDQGSADALDDSDDDGQLDQNALPSIGPAAFYAHIHGNVSVDSISTLSSQVSLDNDLATARDRFRTTSFGSVTSEDSSGNRPNLDFHHVASTDILEALQRGVDPDNIKLELSSLRMATNASEHQMQRAVVVALMKRLSGLVESGFEPKKAVSHTFTPAVCRRLVQPRFDVGATRTTDQVGFLLLMQSDLCHRHKGTALMQHTSNALFMNDIIEHDGFEQWWNDPRSSAEDAMTKMREGMKPFMDAIQEEEEESEESDEDEDESSED